MTFFRFVNEARECNLGYRNINHSDEINQLFDYIEVETSDGGRKLRIRGRRVSNRSKPRVPVASSHNFHVHSSKQLSSYDNSYLLALSGISQKSSTSNIKFSIDPPITLFQQQGKKNGVVVIMKMKSSLNLNGMTGNGILFCKESRDQLRDFSTCKVTSSRFIKNKLR